MEPVTEQMVKKWLILGESPLLSYPTSVFPDTTYQLVHGVLMLTNAIEGRTIRSAHSLEDIHATGNLLVGKHD